ncbi:MAG TPA: pilin [Candidatus Levybacteria bacterium]|nr:pilin [Candidatus Levybacteria bacterium]
MEHEELLAQFRVPGESHPIVDPIGINLSLSDLINFGLNALFVIAILATLAFLIWGGISWITSGGDKEKLEKARKTIIYAIVGLVVVLLSVVIMNFIGTFLGIKVFNSSSSSQSPYKKPAENLSTCPDGSGNYWCGGSSSCAECSPVKDCSSGVYTMASCSGTPDNFSWCTIDGSIDECAHLKPSCEGGIVTCVKPRGVERGHCETFSCPGSAPNPGRRGS